MPILQSIGLVLVLLLVVPLLLLGILGWRKTRQDRASIASKTAARAEVDSSGGRGEER